MKIILKILLIILLTPICIVAVAVLLVLAVTMANGKAQQETLKVTLSPEEIGFTPTGDGLLHIEGAEPVPITPTRCDGK